MAERIQGTFTESDMTAAVYPMQSAWFTYDPGLWDEAGYDAAVQYCVRRGADPLFLVIHYYDAFGPEGEPVCVAQFMWESHH